MQRRGQRLAGYCLYYWGDAALATPVPACDESEADAGVLYSVQPNRLLDEAKQEAGRSDKTTKTGSWGRTARVYYVPGPLVPSVPWCYSLSSDGEPGWHSTFGEGSLSPDA